MKCIFDGTHYRIRDTSTGTLLSARFHFEQAALEYIANKTRLVSKAAHSARTNGRAGPVADPNYSKSNESRIRANEPLRPIAHAKIDST